MWIPAELSSERGFSSCVCWDRAPSIHVWWNSQIHCSLPSQPRAVYSMSLVPAASSPDWEGLSHLQPSRCGRWQESCALLSPQAGGWIWGVNPNQSALCTTKDRGGQPGLLQWLFRIKAIVNGLSCDKLKLEFSTWTLQIKHLDSKSMGI